MTLEVSTPARPGTEQPCAGAGPAPWVESALWLQGMHCAACAGLIQSAILDVGGVRTAEVSAAQQRVKVSWNPARADLASIIRAIERAGYGAEIDDGQASHEARARERKRLLWPLFVAWFCAMQVMMLATPSYVAASHDISPDLAQLMNWAQWLLCLPVMVFSARPFFQQAARALRTGRITMDVPVAVGMLVMFLASTVATFAPSGPLGSEVVFDSLSMFAAILLTGRWVDMQLRHRAAQSLERLLHEAPQSVQRLDDSGAVRLVGRAELKLGDRLRVSAGEQFPADAVILKGSTQVRESLMTGESLPVLREPGQSVWCGSVNEGPPVEVCVTALGTDTRWARLVDMAERAAMERPPLVQLADRWAAPFLWGVMALALLAAAVWWWVDPARSLWVAVAVLVVTCPCALSLAAPAALTSAARAYAREGVLMQRMAAIEDLAAIDQMVFDKTGTLTQDRLSLVAIRTESAGVSPMAALSKASTLAAWSRHPASRAVVEAASTLPAAMQEWSQVQERPGLGVEAVDRQGQRWRLGRRQWVCGAAHGTGPEAVTGTAAGAAHSAVPEGLTLAFGPLGQPQAEFDLEDTVRSDAQQAVRELATIGVSGSVMSGDAPHRVAAVSASLGLPVLRSGALPQDKQAIVAALQRSGHVVAMVGDGINDAPVLGQAQVSIAMGHGSAATVARADFVIVSSNLQVLPQLVKRARLTRAVIRQNLTWALVYNLSAIPLALLGWLPPWAAGLGMTLSSLLVVFNSRRAGFALRA